MSSDCLSWLFRGIEKLTVSRNANRMMMFFLNFILEGFLINEFINIFF